MDTLSPSGYVLVSRAWGTSSTLILHPATLTTVSSCSFRWHPNECKGCCCWFSVNTATFHSSGACRHRAHGRGSEGVGYVMCIHSMTRTCQIVRAAKSVASVACRGGACMPCWSTSGCMCHCVTFPCGVSILPSCRRHRRRRRCYGRGYGAVSFSLRSVQQQAVWLSASLAQEHQRRD